MTPSTQSPWQKFITSELITRVKTEKIQSFSQASIEGQGMAGRRKDGSDASWSDLSCSRQLITLPPASINSLRKCTSKYKIQMKIVLTRPHPFGCTVLILLFNNCNYSYANTRFCCHKSRHYHDITIPCIKFEKMFLLEWND